MTDAVTYELRDHVARITLDRPEARNAVNGAVAEGLEAAVDALEADDTAWVGVLFANTEGQARPVFCAGADLAVVGAGRSGEMFTERGGFGGFVYRERSKPIIAAVDGLATAGGLELVLAADLVIASTRSSFGLAEVKRNLIAGAGGLFRLPRAIGTAAAMDAILTGEPIAAQRAHDLGLISRLVEPAELTAEALLLAGQIAANAPLAVRASRQVVRAAHDADEEQLKALSAQLLTGVMAAEDTREGIAAFLEKRPPVWQGR